MLQNSDEHHSATATFAVHEKLPFVSYGPYFSWAFKKRDLMTKRYIDLSRWRPIDFAEASDTKRCVRNEFKRCKRS